MDVVTLNARLASPEALEEGIRRMIAEKAPDTNALSRLVVRLRTVRPSEALFPAVRVLLRSDDVTVGIETAKLLGREELLPDLAGLLDSMDATVRTAAKEAIDSIVALRKLKEEARRGAGGK
jgi:HEAT repeat protein